MWYSTTAQSMRGRGTSTKLICARLVSMTYTGNNNKLAKADARKLERQVNGGDVNRLARYVMGEMMW